MRYSQQLFLRVPRSTKTIKKTWNINKYEYTPTRRSSSAGSYTNKSSDLMSSDITATPFWFSTKKIKVGGKTYRYRKTDKNSRARFRTKEALNITPWNEKYVENLQNIIDKWEWKAVFWIIDGNDVKLRLNWAWWKNFGTHFLKHGWFPLENMVETANNYTSRETLSNGNMVFYKELSNWKKLRLILDKDYNYISFYEPNR